MINTSLVLFFFVLFFLCVCNLAVYLLPSCPVTCVSC